MFFMAHLESMQRMNHHSTSNESMVWSDLKTVNTRVCNFFHNKIRERCFPTFVQSCRMAENLYDKANSAPSLQQCADFV